MRLGKHQSKDCLRTVHQIINWDGTQKDWPRCNQESDVDANCVIMECAPIKQCNTNNYVDNRKYCVIEMKETHNTRKKERETTRAHLEDMAMPLKDTHT